MRCTLITQALPAHCRSGASPCGEARATHSLHPVTRALARPPLILGASSTVPVQHVRCSLLPGHSPISACVPRTSGADVRAIARSHPPAHRCLWAVLRPTHARLDLAPSFDGELPVQVTTQACGLDGNDCGQQVALVDATPSFDATVQARRPHFAIIESERLRIHAVTSPNLGLCRPGTAIDQVQPNRRVAGDNWNCRYLSSGRTTLARSGVTPGWPR
jgi:hypothetical protein